MTTTEWLLTMKPSFLAEWTALQGKEAAQIAKKLELLSQDPTPDAKVKKQLKGWDGKLHRLRSGDYRIFYTFDAPHVSILALRRRAEDTYDDEVENELLGGGSVQVPDRASPARDSAWNRWLSPHEPVKKEQRKKVPLRGAITKALLDQLRVEARHHARLLAITTEDDLLEADDVPEQARLQIVDALVGRPLEEVRRLPDLRLEDAGDLVRYREGGLLAFLLKLDPDQEKLVPWAAGGSGPTLLKGGPGTGKSTVALYRARVMIDRLRAKGVEKPRVLFTTYTNALVRFSEQLLAELLRDDARLVEVKTADSVIVSIAHELGLRTGITQGDALDPIIERALAEVRLEGNVLVQEAQRRTLDRLGGDYVREEVLSVIGGRGLRTLADYQEASRPGRRVPLGRTAREAVWRVWESLSRVLAEERKETWETLRAQVAERVSEGAVAPRFDAVIIDEAQDLSATQIRALVGLCREPGAIFLTADANQSIYGAGFRWTDVHATLRFQGRTAQLRANHRSTREIGEAAEAYLSHGRLDEDAEPTRYVHGGPLPAVRTVGSADDETRLIAQFFRSAARDLRLGMGACAVLCPTNDGVKRIARALGKLGVNAHAVVPKELDLASAGVKVITLKSAKGLELPIVAIAGLGDGGYPHVPAGADEAQVAERMELERRTLYVAMTRAMRALLVVCAAGMSPALSNGFDPARWNTGAE